MVLEIKSHARQVDERLHARLTEFLGITDTAPLQDQWRAQSTTRHDDLLPSPVDLVCQLAGMERLRRHGADAHCAAAFEDDLVDLCVDG